METLKYIHSFTTLSELSLSFDKKSMKTPKHLSILMRFLRANSEKLLRIFRLSVIVLGVHWKSTIEEMEEIVTVDQSFSTNLELGIELNDSCGEKGTILNKTFLALHLFVTYTSNLGIHVENQETASLAEFLPQQSDKQYLRVKKLKVTFVASKEFPNFKSFNIDTIAHNFPNLTELFIQDEGQRNSLEGGKRSAALLGDTEIQIISAILVKLKILRIWTDLKNLTDYGITGICPEEIYNLQTNRTHSIKGVEHDLRSSFSSLSEIRELSLRGVGNGVTSISARYGFENLKKLKRLEIIGAFKISRAARRILSNKIKKYDPDCTLKMSSY